MANLLNPNDLLMTSKNHLKQVLIAGWPKTNLNCFYFWDMLKQADFIQGKTERNLFKMTKLKLSHGI